MPFETAAFDDGCISFVADQPANFVVQDEQFMDSGPPPIPGLRAGRTAGATIKRRLRLSRNHAQPDELFIVRVIGLFAIGTDFSDQPLSQDRHHRGGDKERLDTHVDHGWPRLRHHWYAAWRRPSGRSETHEWRSRPFLGRGFRRS